MIVQSNTLQRLWSVFTGYNLHVQERMSSNFKVAALTQLFLTGASRRDNISPVLRSLHWLPVKQRVDYKLATLVYKSLRGQAPSYLVDDCQLIADFGRPQLHSAHPNVLTVPRTNTWLGDRSFSVAGPRIWNSLPALLRQPDIDFGHFKRLLKAFLFGETAAHQWHFDFNAPCISRFTYLLYYRAHYGTAPLHLA